MTRYMLLPVVVLVLATGCGSMTGSVRARPGIDFLQPPHNRLLVDDPRITITFDDATKVVGQPCTCAAAGFRIAQVGLAALEGDRLPVRGEILLVASKDHAVSDVVAYCLAAPRRQDPDRAGYVVDPSLSERPGVWRYVLADPARRRAVEVTYYKGKLMPEPLRTRLQRIEERGEQGEASVEELALYRREMARMVGNLLDPEVSKDYLEVTTLPYEAMVRWYPAWARGPGKQ